MKPLPFTHLYAAGDLYTRAMANMDRLEQAEYRVPAVMQPDTYDWPGDTEGRTILALALLAQALHREPRYLDEILAAVRGRLNERGYMGRICPDGQFDEQQLSGHNWLLRGLCEVYLWRREDWVLDAVRRMVEGLLLPARGYYRLYPVDPGARRGRGEAIGELTGQLIGHWHTSTDVGCAFIMLDAATQAQGLLRGAGIALPALDELLDEMVETYTGVDLAGLSFQTHSTLSALRGVLRYHELTGRADLLATAQRVYGLYRGRAITENFANYNWFGRPTWTEPCAVIDSFIVANTLWRHTGDAAYLEDAHKILHNAMAYAQRPNGGYGCDVCVGADDVFLAPAEGAFEAYWCCTMRGGEGLSRAIEALYLMRADGVDLPFYGDSVARLAWGGGEIALMQRTRYPLAGEVALDVLHASVAAPVTVRLHVPSWAAGGPVQLCVNAAEQPCDVSDGFVTLRRQLAAGDRIRLSFPLGLRVEGIANPHNLGGHHTFWHGPFVLGLPNAGEPEALPRDADLAPLGRGRYGVGSRVLAPIDDMLYLTPDAALNDRRQLLFSD